MGAASAASDDNDTMLSDDSGSEDIMTQVNSVEKTDTVSTDAADNKNLSSGESELLTSDDSSAGEFRDLNKEITFAMPNAEITLDKDYTFNSKYDYYYSEGIEISKPITINGNNHIIDGNGAARIFDITSNNVVLKNIIFIKK